MQISYLQDYLISHRNDNDGIENDTAQDVEEEEVTFHAKNEHTGVAEVSSIESNTEVLVYWEPVEVGKTASEKVKPVSEKRSRRCNS